MYEGILDGDSQDCFAREGGMGCMRGFRMDVSGEGMGGIGNGVDSTGKNGIDTGTIGEDSICNRRIGEDGIDKHGIGENNIGKDNISETSVGINDGGIADGSIGGFGSDGIVKHIGEDSVDNNGIDAEGIGKDNIGGSSIGEDGIDMAATVAYARDANECRVHNCILMRFLTLYRIIW